MTGKALLLAAAVLGGCAGRAGSGTGTETLAGAGRIAQGETAGAEVQAAGKTGMAGISGIGETGPAGTPEAGGAGNEALAYGAPTAEAAVSGFLDAAKLGDFGSMARLFGTADGPAERRWGRAETEQRMFVLAALLKHGSYGLRVFPGSATSHETRLIADLEGSRVGSVSVPFVAVSSRGRWFVERIVMDALTG